MVRRAVRRSQRALQHPVLLRLNGPVDARALAHALADLVARHESLRTVFPRWRGGPASRCWTWTRHARSSTCGSFPTSPGCAPPCARPRAGVRPLRRHPGARVAAVGARRDAGAGPVGPPHRERRTSLDP
ncbi:hypothetical protein E4K10_48040 [Streptomyces sp. T1317-0309]|nr:hypothetical protein E4K10_48040 [Streptomyces sp. T1317-0309]